MLTRLIIDLLQDFVKQQVRLLAVVAFTLEAVGALLGAVAFLLFDMTLNERTFWAVLLSLWAYACMIMLFEDERKRFEETKGARWRPAGWQRRLQYGFFLCLMGSGALLVITSDEFWPVLMGITVGVAGVLSVRRIRTQGWMNLF